MDREREKVDNQFKILVDMLMTEPPGKYTHGIC